MSLQVSQVALKSTTVSIDVVIMLKTPTSFRWISLWDWNSGRKTRARWQNHCDSGQCILDSNVTKYSFNERETHLVQFSSAVQEVWFRCHIRNSILWKCQTYHYLPHWRQRLTHFMNVSFHGMPSFLHLHHPGKKRLLKHSSHSRAVRFGKVALNKRKSALARLKISSQFWRGTTYRIQRLLKDGS